MFSADCQYSSFSYAGSFSPASATNGRNRKISPFFCFSYSRLPLLHKVSGGWVILCRNWAFIAQSVWWVSAIVQELGICCTKCLVDGWHCAGIGHLLRKVSGGRVPLCRNWAFAAQSVWWVSDFVPELGVCCTKCLVGEWLCAGIVRLLHKGVIKNLLWGGCRLRLGSSAVTSKEGSCGVGSFV